MVRAGARALKLRQGEPRGGFQRVRFEIPLAGGDGCLRRRGGEPSRPGVRPWGRNEKVGEVVCS